MYFFFFKLLDTKFTKLKCFTGKTYVVHGYASCFYVFLKYSKLKRQSCIIIPLQALHLPQA